jgi:hypothetical protein
MQAAEQCKRQKVARGCRHARSTSQTVHMA